ncbi:MAG: helix-turn-helix domain-containing protein [Rhodospirillaceae bacterium]|nr:helix-turn-helix domain-containing protein [Rhodospirillaceae bacterium]
MHNDDLVALSKIPLFAGLSLAQLEELTQAGFVHALPTGATLFEQGEMPGFLHVILRGAVAVVGTAPADQAADAPAHREAIITVFGANDALIAPAVLLTLPYMMSARVIEAARIAFLPAQAIRDLLANHAGFAQESALMLARHWRLLVRELKDLKLRSVSQRLAGYLLSLAPAAQTAPAQVALPFDRRVLASWLGTTPENLSRSIAQLGGLGVAIRGRKVHIADPDLLHRFSREDNLR